MVASRDDVLAELRAYADTGEIRQDSWLVYFLADGVRMLQLLYELWSG